MLSLWARIKFKVLSQGHSSYASFFSISWLQEWVQPRGFKESRKLLLSFAPFFLQLLPKSLSHKSTQSPSEITVICSQHNNTSCWDAVTSPAQGQILCWIWGGFRAPNTPRQWPDGCRKLYMHGRAVFLDLGGESWETCRLAEEHTCVWFSIIYCGPQVAALPCLSPWALWPAVNPLKISGICFGKGCFLAGPSPTALEGRWPLISIKCTWYLGNRPQAGVNEHIQTAFFCQRLHYYHSQGFRGITHNPAPPREKAGSEERKWGWWEETQIWRLPPEHENHPAVRGWEKELVSAAWQALSLPP